MWLSFLNNYEALFTDDMNQFWSVIIKYPISWRKNSNKHKLQIAHEVYLGSYALFFYLKICLYFLHLIFVVVIRDERIRILLLVLRCWFCVLLFVNLDVIYSLIANSYYSCYSFNFRKNNLCIFYVTNMAFTMESILQYYILITIKYQLKLKYLFEPANAIMIQCLITGYLRSKNSYFINDA